MDKTKVIRVFETFAGIGAQHKALSNIDKSKKYFKVVQTSEWDARAIIAYAQIHHRQKFEKELVRVKKYEESFINQYLLERTFSLNSKTPSHVIRKDYNFKANLMAANIVNNNYPDITKVKGETLKDIDLLTYSFPCQGLSIANMGRAKGIREEANSTSNLIWQIRRILLDAIEQGVALPKYLLMENVKALVGPQHKPDYDRWTSFLSEIGYKTRTVVLNGLHHGSLQKRERVFGLSVLNWDDQRSEEDFKKVFELKEYSKKLSAAQRQLKYKEVLSASEGKNDEIGAATPNDTPSRQRMVDGNHKLLERRKWKKGSEWTFNTLTTKQDRHPNIGMVELPSDLKTKGKCSHRFITNREAYMIMGFDSEDFDRVKTKYEEKIITKESLYRQAGNSIIVSVLEDIFKYVKDIERGNDV